jgi:hypothetical protein
LVAERRSTGGRRAKGRPVISSRKPIRATPRAPPPVPVPDRSRCEEALWLASLPRDPPNPA